MLLLIGFWREVNRRCNGSYGCSSNKDKTIRLRGIAASQRIVPISASQAKKVDGEHDAKKGAL